MKLVRETLLEDGVGDKYFQTKNPAQKGEFEDFEKVYRAQQLAKKSQQSKDHNKIVYREGDWKLIKNPTSISDIGPGARGVISPSGDVYMESHYFKKIHNDILPILFNKGELKGTFKKGWGKKLPTESGFLTVQRYKDTPHIAIGESNKVIYDEHDWTELKPIYNKFLDVARKKNPKLSLSDKLVGVKTFKRKQNDEEGSNKISESIELQINLIKNHL